MDQFYQNPRPTARRTLPLATVPRSTPSAPPWLRRQSVHALRAAHAAQGGGLKRVLGFGSLVAIGIGCTIGAGIFVWPGFVAATHSGPAVMISFVIAAVACGIAALCYAELAVLIPASGSAYSYTYATLGEFAAWMIGWMLLLEYGLSNSAVAAGWGNYLAPLLKGVGIALPPQLMYATGEALPNGAGYGVFNVPAAIAVAIPTILLLFGIRESARFNNAMVAAKIAVLVMFVAFCAPAVDAARFTPFMPFGWPGVMTGAAFLFFLFIGFDAVSTVAEECVDPQRDLPRAIVAGLAIVTALYVSVAAVLVGVVPLADLKELKEPLAYALTLAGHPIASHVLAVVAVVGILAIILIAAIGQTRILYVMARDGLMPKFMGRVSEKTGTPVASTILLGLITGCIAATVPLGVLAELVSIGTLAAFSAVSIAVVVLRRREPDLVRTFKTPMSPALPIVGVCANLYLMTTLPHEVWSRFAIWLAIGVAIYFGWGMRSAGKVFDPTQEAAPPGEPPLAT
jgi:APA family basic amino acid/polyamine antiporter